MQIVVTMPRGAVRDSFIPAEVAAELETLGSVRWNVMERNYTKVELARALSDAQVCVSGWGTEALDADVVASAPKLQVVAHTGGTVAPIVSEALYAHGVTVLSGNALYAESVAEGFIAYVLCALRELPRYTQTMLRDGWAPAEWQNRGLLDRTVGLIGFGAIAKHIVRMLAPFHTKIHVFADHVTAQEAAAWGVQKAQTMREVFETCDIVSLQLARTHETYHLIDESLLSCLRPGALLVNTSRGAVMDEAALCRALQSGRFGAVLDVYEQEPLPMESPLRTLPNVLLIPHMAGPTMDRRPYVTRALIEEIRRFMRGEALQLVITPEMAARMTR